MITLRTWVPGLVLGPAGSGVVAARCRDLRARNLTIVRLPHSCMIVRKTVFLLLLSAACSDLRKLDHRVYHDASRPLHRSVEDEPPT